MKRSSMSRRMSPARAASTKRMAEARPILEERSQGRCDKCAMPLDPSDSGFEFQMHHRLSRARGGDDSVANLMAVHGASCHLAIHARPDQAADNGWILPSGASPEESSLSFRGQGAFLTDSGRVLWIEPFEETDDDGDHYRDLLIDDELEVS